VTSQSRWQGDCQVQVKNFLLATGSSPYRPDDIDFSHPAIFDSDSILGLDSTPRNIIIYGAGVIGCEYASIFLRPGYQSGSGEYQRMADEFPR